MKDHHIPKTLINMAQNITSEFIPGSRSLHTVRVLPQAATPEGSTANKLVSPTRNLTRAQTQSFRRMEPIKTRKTESCHLVNAILLDAVFPAEPSSCIFLGAVLLHLCHIVVSHSNLDSHRRIFITAFGLCEERMRAVVANMWHI